MLKWLIAIVGAVLVGWFAWFQFNATKIAYVNGLAPYDVMPGREYLLQLDCHVFAWRHESASRYPFLGVNHPQAGRRVSPLPHPASAADVGRELPEVRILDFIPKGTPFRLLSVRREQHRAGVTITYEIKFLDEVDRPYLRVDIRPLLLPAARPGDVPAIDPTVAVPWIRR